MPDVVPPPGRLTLSTVRSHDQWNTTIYSDDDRYRGLKNLAHRAVHERRRHARSPTAASRVDNR
jgi:hypothetical protein